MSPFARIRNNRTRYAIALLALTLVALGVARTARHDRGRAAAAPPLVTRVVADATVETPAAWRALARTREHATWGDSARRHTVTLAAIDASEDSLASIVRDLAAQAANLAPGARVVGALESRDVKRGARGDSALLLRLEIPRGDGRVVRVVQAWRRDTRAARDIVATWTSTDGSWPADPGQLLPGSRLR
ncbi:MAG: hypothetical protein H7287_04145 [Thermoleophilia bacterium]|nr:hypothetical protein [Thermoleophilia bacterium]